MPVPQVGEPAPDFELDATGDRLIRLGDFRDRQNVVLVFYPFDWSPVCSLQLPNLQAHLNEFHALNAEVLGISVDSRHSHRAFAEHLGLSFPLLSDYDREVTQTYGVQRDGAFAERALFVIDKRGIIRYVHVNPQGEIPDNEPVFEVLRQIEEQA
ncbi:MAG TPA: peroxiredoxin [Anaerolineae bacterium]|nr:peroxiredoxin [Anaerolineae bacterium]